MKRTIAIFVLVAPFMTLPVDASGSTDSPDTWTNSTGNTNWSTPGNWQSGSVPASGSDVTFPYTTQGYVVTLDTSATVNSLTFGNTFYEFGTATASSLTIGSGGLTATSSSVYFFPNLLLGSSQTWNIDGYSDVAVYGNISEPEDAGSSLTQSGAGMLYLFGTNSFSGGFTLAGGTALLYSNGAVGTGPVTIESGTTFGAYYSSVTLSNSVSLANNVTLGQPYGGSSDLTFTGAVTVATASPSTTIILPNSSTVIFGDMATGGGSLTGASSGTNLVFQTPTTGTYGGGIAVIAGSLANISTMTADGTGIVFTNPAALPTTSIQSIDGYIGMGPKFDSADVDGHAAPGAIISLITDPADFTGTIGFDTDPTTLATSGPAAFSGTIDLSRFTNSGFLGLGSYTSAVLGSGADITPVGGIYPFGGGGGRLVVQSALTGANGLTANSPTDTPLTLVLQGTNTFTGSISVTNSYLILDSSSAFPFASGQEIQLGPSGYIGYTENWTTGGDSPTVHTPADLIALLDPNNVDPTAILGLDSSAPASLPRTVSDNIDLSSLPTSIYIGTTTEQLTLTGTITPAQDGLVKLAGLNNGELIVASNLTDNGTGSSATVSVIVGHPNPAMATGGSVELAGNNTYTGGTSLVTGTLYVGSNTALGTGDLTIDNGAWNAALVPDNSLSPGLTNITLANNVVNNASWLALGGSSAVSLTLNGAISGTGGLEIEGPTTLNGANSYSGDTDVFYSTVTVGNDSGLGGGDVLLEGGTINFTTAHPTIGTLSDYPGGDYVNAINLAAGSTFTIVENYSTAYDGIITDPGPPGAGATLVKTGPGALTLEGDNTYSGGTIINESVLVAANDQALGTGPVTVNPASVLGLQPGTIIINPITLNGSSGVGNGAFLAGVGTFAPTDATLVIGNNAGISPGSMLLGGGALNVPLLGQLTLGGGENPISVTFGSNGTYAWGIQNPAGTAGTDWDLIQVNGNLVFTASLASPFVFQLTTFDSTNNVGLLTGFNSSQPGQWVLLSTTGGITGLTGDNYMFDVSGFQSGLLPTDEFSLSLSSNGDELLLNFTPVPEPSTYALMAMGLGLVLLGCCHRKRRVGPAAFSRLSS